jgi:hypothetical protein
MANKTVRLVGKHSKDCLVHRDAKFAKDPWYAPYEGAVVMRDSSGRRLTKGRYGCAWLRLRCSYCGEAELLMRIDNVITRMAQQELEAQRRKETASND